MMAGKAVQFGVFRPTGTASAAGETLQTVTQLHALPHRPLFGSEPGSLLGIFPVFRHHRTEQIELEGQVRMPGRNHLVVD